MTHITDKIHEKLTGHKKSSKDICNYDKGFVVPENLKFLAMGYSASGRNHFAEEVYGKRSSSESNTVNQVPNTEIYGAAATDARLQFQNDDHAQSDDRTRNVDKR
ncbi:hypothetical protein BABINDRAFT_159365 [Babjeviella inositovora NRRL Y-12698]|uniref:Uncharacterized protein n=1 Tax=Babjeviella inositovora NRRL Y-12698 TaxID=984486 RepID=A0A1E3R0F4_9ASCO|nr:uncharacterized protein BABINDRAFT_159365 [Babjeviella inositovora NRRL Y-12698]ODQ82867.1 hypothetical protein BABINDRAFT_159365 [Babjeviella inositovora NRRL Y-12698]